MQLVVGLAVALGSARAGWSAPVVAPPLAASDSKYLQENAQGSVYDFATAEVAVQKARSPQVQSYAVRLLEDHAQINKTMLLLANRRGLTLPVTLSDEDKPKIESLLAQSPQAFDRAYLQEAIRINAEDVRQAGAELSTTRDPEIRNIVAKFLRIESKHLSAARDLLQKM